MPYTLGFADRRRRAEHFGWHGNDFKARGVAHYEFLADRYLGGPKSSSVDECKRKRGDVIRFEHRSDQYGILSSQGIIRTFYRPMPEHYFRSGGYPLPKIGAKTLAHTAKDNATYFKGQCKR